MHIAPMTAAAVRLMAVVWSLVNPELSVCMTETQAIDVRSREMYCFLCMAEVLVEGYGAEGCGS